MNRDAIVGYLQPKWIVTEERKTLNGRGTVLNLNTGQTVEIYDDGTFHVSGKGWKDINRHIQESKWPQDAAIMAAAVRAQLKAIDCAGQSYFSEGLDCIQFAGAPRAAIVLAWSGFIDLLHRRFASDFDAFNQAYAVRFETLHKKSGDIRALDRLREFQDWEALEIGKQVGLFKKHAHKQLDAMRDLRNNCAHVEEFQVTTHIALGYYSQLAAFLPSIL